MHAVAVEVKEADEIIVPQETSPGDLVVRATIEQVPVLTEIIYQARAKEEETRYRRQIE